MKKILLPMFALATISSFAQTKTFAITSEKKESSSGLQLEKLIFQLENLQEHCILKFLNKTCN